MSSNSQNLDVLYEDNHFIVVNKRTGDIVQGDKTGDTPLSDIVKSFLKNKYAKTGNVFLGVVHRIDRPTSGIVVFAKTSKALKRINELFRYNKVKKTYWAITKNIPHKDKGSLTSYIKKNAKNNKSSIFSKSTTGVKKAILHYKVLKKTDKYYLLEILLETGRHHQIRCQLGSIKCPIKGDLKYGFPRPNSNGGIHLHSRKIEFTHPISNKSIIIKAPTPTDVVWDACFRDSFL